MKAMEIDTIKNTIMKNTAGNSSVDDDESSASLLKNIQDSQKGIRAIEQDLVSAVSRELIRTNHSTRGLILWLNPGVSRDIKPEPIYLRQTIQYMRSNCDYDSDGFDIYDLYNFSENYQYDKILEKLSSSGNAVFTAKTLDVQIAISEMEKVLLSTPYDVVVDAKKLENLMKDIIATAVEIFEEVDQNKIRAPNCTGNFVNHCNI
jgi:hypothetical protein